MKAVGHMEGTWKSWGTWRERGNRGAHGGNVKAVGHMERT